MSPKLHNDWRLIKIGDVCIFLLIGMTSLSQSLARPLRSRSIMSVSSAPLYRIPIRWRARKPRAIYPEVAAAMAQRSPSAVDDLHTSGETEAARTKRLAEAAKNDAPGGVIKTELQHPTKGSSIVLLGSKHHLSTASSEQMVAHINALKPAILMVEVPQGRLNDITHMNKKYQLLKKSGRVTERYDIAEAIGAGLSLPQTEVICGDMPEQLQHTRLCHNFSWIDIARSFWELRYVCMDGDVLCVCVCVIPSIPVTPLAAVSVSHDLLLC